MSLMRAPSAAPKSASMASIALRAAALSEGSSGIAALVGQMLEPAQLDANSIALQAEFANEFGELREPVAISTVQRRYGGEWFELHAQWISLGRANVVSMLRMVDRRNIRCQRRPPD